MVPRMWLCRIGSVATLNLEYELAYEGGWPVSGCQVEHPVDELILTPNIIPAYPSSLSLPYHVHRLIPLNRSPRRLELSESLLGIDSSFDGAVVLLDDVIQVLHGPVPATTAESPFLFKSRDCRGVDGRQIRVDDARLRVRRVDQGLAKQLF